MNRRLLVTLVVGATVFATSLVGPAGVPLAQADRVHRAYRGRVVLLKKRAPMRFRSSAAFIRFLRVNRKKHLWPKDKKETRWKVEYFAFFKRPANDVEVKIKFFDVTEGKRFVAGDSVYLRNRKEKILASNIELRKPRFNINRKYMMYITNARNHVLASTTFWLRGKREVYSGKVTFSDKDAKLR